MYVYNLIRQLSQFPANATVHVIQKMGGHEYIYDPLVNQLPEPDGPDEIYILASGTGYCRD